MYFVIVLDREQERMATTWGERLFGKILVTYPGEGRTDWVRIDRVRRPTPQELREWFENAG